ncbi:hypothetical protein Hanom_Chr16g01458481 [Helianthus anomalus]
MLKQRPLGHAISTHVTIYPTLLQEFWWNVETIYRGTSMWIRSKVMNRGIILNEETLIDALQLNDDPDTTFFPREKLEETLREMSYRIPTFRGRSTNLIGHFNELSYRFMEVVHAVVQVKPYNFSKFLMRDLEANMHTRQPFLIFCRFVTKVITSQLDFGGVTYWYL